MTSLATFTRETRVVLKVGFLITVVIIVIALIFQLAMYIQKVYFTKPIPPDEGFGKLPSLGFSSESNISYRINTLTGFLPIFPDRVKVYKIIKPEINLLTLGTVRGKLKDQGFSQNEKKLTELEYQWEHKDDPTKVIKYNIQWNDFDITSNFYSNESVILRINFPDENEAKSMVTKFLEKVIGDISLLDIEASGIFYEKIQDGKLIQVADKSLAQVYRITIVYKPIDEMQIFFDDANDFQMSFFVAGGRAEPQIVEAHFNNRVFDLSRLSTYPLKTAEASYQDLIEGRTKRFELATQPSSDITDVFLAYYLGSSQGEYLFPIVVFQGKNFYSYVEAVIP